ncbi:TPA: deoxyribodipyrimidine photo-lyase [Legionella anisa]
MSTSLVWFRQDLRLADNPAFFEAYTNHERLAPVYILAENSVLGEAQARSLGADLVFCLYP